MKFGDNKCYEHKLAIDFSNFNIPNKKEQDEIKIAEAGYNGCGQAINFGMKTIISLCWHDTTLKLKIQNEELRDGEKYVNSREINQEFNANKIEFKFYMLTAEEEEEEEEELDYEENKENVHHDEEEEEELDYEENEENVMCSNTILIMYSDTMKNERIYYNANWSNDIQTQSVGPYQFAFKNYNQVENVQIDVLATTYSCDEPEKLPKNCLIMIK